jgi:hypothetical protein
VFEIGNSLREARLRQQLELTEIEQATKIRARYLQALEEESFDALPAQTYVKGFLRTYADYLGLDGQLYVDEYNSRYSVGDEEPREPVVARRTAAVQQRHRRLESRGVIFALAGIGALFALVIAAWKFSGNNNQPPIPIPGTTTRSTKSAPPTQQHRAARPKKIRFFVIAATGPSWMEVRNYSASGRTMFTGTLDLHKNLFFTARRLWIDIGRPAGLKASINGRVVTFPGNGRSVTVLVTRTGVTVAPRTA